MAAPTPTRSASGSRATGPTQLFQLLVTALLLSARISDRIAVAAAQALFRHGYTDAHRMADATWQQRVDALGEGHYVRYDESTATYLGETAELVLDRYGGDLRRLRRRADGDAAATTCRSSVPRCCAPGCRRTSTWFGRSARQRRPTRSSRR